MLTLVIGDKNISSWSLRPWLALKMTGAPFEERMIRLRVPGSPATSAVYRPGLKDDLKAVNAAGKVPVLLDGAVKVWESLAICEYLAERFPEANLWPQVYDKRAVARAIASEMHAGFGDMRRELTMDVVGRHPGMAFSDGARADIARVIEIWTECRAANAECGPFLFGHFTIADAFFAPVVTRFQTYGVELPAAAQAYADAVRDLAPMREWCAAAAAEVAAGAGA